MNVEAHAAHYLMENAIIIVTIRCWFRIEETIEVLEERDWRIRFMSEWNMYDHVRYIEGKHNNNISLQSKNSVVHEKDGPSQG